jgi:hypothetical protein
MWGNGKFKFEIRGSSFGKQNSISMLALNPTDWLTASASYKLVSPWNSPTPAPWQIDAVFDNGKIETGTIDRTICSSIHWGPPKQNAVNRRYAWGSPCDDEDKTQRGWSVDVYNDKVQGTYCTVLYCAALYSSTVLAHCTHPLYSNTVLLHCAPTLYSPYTIRKGGQYVVLKYSINQGSTDPNKVPFTGCLDRTGTTSGDRLLVAVYKCTNLQQQRWRMLPAPTMSTDPPTLAFALQSYSVGGLQVQSVQTVF